MNSATLFGLVSDPTGARTLAHQGGWDEVLLVVGPLAAVAGLLWMANRRVSAQLEAAELAADREGNGEVEGSTRPDPRP